MTCQKSRTLHLDNFHSISDNSWFMVFHCICEKKETLSSKTVFCDNKFKEFSILWKELLKKPS